MKFGNKMTHNEKLNYTLKNKAKNAAKEFLKLSEDHFELKDADTDKNSKIIYKIIMNEKK